MPSTNSVSVSAPSAVWGSSQSEPLDLDKREVQKQWDNNPCGADTVQGYARESLEYYRAVRDYRYRQYAPWMDEVINFSQWQGKDLLEIGVGMGSDHFRFAKAGNRMTALDLSREHLRQTERHLSLEGLTTTAHYGDAEIMPFPDASFDVVYTFGVIHHTPNTEVAVNEIHRVLRPGGTAIVGLYHRDSWFFWVSTLLAQGVLKFGLIRKGWRKLLSEIEYRSKDNTAQPLVKVYSRKQSRDLFSDFSQVHLQTAHLEASHLSRFQLLVRGVSRAELERRFGRYGWYVVVKAVK